jgi:hypothetical protein
VVREPREATWGKGDGGRVSIGNVDGDSGTDSGTDSGGGDCESFTD